MKYFLQSIVTTLLFLLIFTSANAQSVKANEFIKNGQFAEAIAILEKTTDKTKPGYEDLTNLAYCYIMVHEYDKAESTYVRIMEHAEKKDDQHFYYGEVLRINGKYEEAKKQYRIYGEAYPSDQKWQQRIKSCDSIPVWERTKSKAIISNYPAVNSSMEELWPWYVNGALYFTSTNKQLLEKCGGKTTFKDPQMSFVFKYSNGNTTYVPMKSKDSISTTAYVPRYGKEVRIVKKIKVTPAGEEMQPSRIEILTNGTWEVFRPDGVDAMATVSHPCLINNGNRIIFASDMAGGKGGTDLYYSDYQNGKWSSPVSLGDNINTTGNEMFPYVSDNGDFLYFASDGHPGYGNLDIFCSMYKNGTWMAPANMKKPYNSIGNDFGLVLSAYNKGYLVSNRWPDSKGAYDIFSFEIPEDVIIPPDTTTPFVYKADKDALYVFYDTESSEIDAAYTSILDSVANLMNKYDYLSLTISANADIRGPETLNDELIECRESAVAQYMQNKGVPAGQLNLTGGNISEEREFAGLTYHVQVGFVMAADAEAWYEKTLGGSYKVNTVAKNNGYAYYTGSGSLEEMRKLQYEINARYNIGAFLIVTYRGILLEDTYYAPNRRAEFRLSN
ncbi:MAG: hypothetical protein C0592_06755 [Marinilabiliales bacterium]|nr:MAG: hypothetical protein C0592_06755 [Marinilabiliales bacterium]